jgi:hypothetical protein
MPKSRYRDIKHNFKVNNNYLYTKKKGDDGYDPCTKFDKPLKVLVHNMNNVTGRADLDNGGVEKIFLARRGFASYAYLCSCALLIL